jgi:hypothetical protein
MKLMLEQGGSSNFAGKWSFSDNGFTYTTSDTQQTKTISWEEYCDAFRRDNKHSIACQFDFWEGKPAVKECSNCNYNDMDPDKYRVEHLDSKEFPCNGCDDKLNHWEPKVKLSSEDAEQVETELPCDTCGHDVKGCCDYNTEDQCCEMGNAWTPKEPEQVETVEADIVQTVPEEQPKPIFSAEHHLREAIQREEEQLKQLGETWKIKQPDTFLKHQTILIALKCYLTDLEYPNPEPVKPVQPELPILKNNDQRKEFIDAYETWPIWIDQKETGERYYRYDLSDKVAMVVKVSLRHVYKGYTETKETDYTSPLYYLLGIKTNYSTKVTYHEDPARTFTECSSNMTDMVNYLKEFQKKGA